MKRDTAERFAAAYGKDRNSVANRTADEVHEIVEDVLRWLARCPVCEDDGAVTFAESAQVTLAGRAVNVAVGESMLCPRCGGLDKQGRRRNDPEYVAWHCFVKGPGSFQCGPDLPATGDGHDRCGYQVMLPVPKGDEK